MAKTLFLSVVLLGLLLTLPPGQALASSKVGQPVTPPQSLLQSDGSINPFDGFGGHQVASDLTAGRTGYAPRLVQAPGVVDGSSAPGPFDQA